MSPRQRVRLIVGLFTGTGFFTMLGMLIFVAIPPENAGVLNALTGALGGSFITIVSFYFGDAEGGEM